jgi:hypothetical protein
VLKFIVDGKEIKEEDIKKSSDDKNLEDIAKQIDNAKNVEILIQD